MKKNSITGVTEGAMRTLLKSALRPIWRRCSRKVFIESKRYQAEQPKDRDGSGLWWTAADCGRVMGCSEKERRPLKAGGLSKKARSVFEIDHVDGITPLKDIRLTLGEHFHSMIYGKQEVVCYTCHKARTAIQSKARHTK